MKFTNCCSVCCVTTHLLDICIVCECVCVRERRECVGAGVCVAYDMSMHM